MLGDPYSLAHTQGELRVCGAAWGGARGVHGAGRWQGKVHPLLWSRSTARNCSSVCMLHCFVLLPSLKLSGVCWREVCNTCPHMCTGTVFVLVLTAVLSRPKRTFRGHCHVMFSWLVTLWIQLREYKLSPRFWEWLICAFILRTFNRKRNHDYDRNNH